MEMPADASVDFGYIFVTAKSPVRKCSRNFSSKNMLEGPLSFNNDQRSSSCYK